MSTARGAWSRHGRWRPSSPATGRLSPAWARRTVRSVCDPISPSAGLMGVVPMVVVGRMVIRGGPALTGRIGRHSTARLAVVAAAILMVAQLDPGVGRSHPQLGSERGVAGGPVGKQGPRAWMRPMFVLRLWHNANATANTVLAPVMRLTARTPAIRAAAVSCVITSRRAQVGSFGCAVWGGITPSS
jgi:hypothetical protein